MSDSSGTKKKKSGLDPKVRNLILYVGPRVIGINCAVYGFVTYMDENDPFRLFAFLVIALATWRICLHVYRRIVLPPKLASSYGKWVIVTGSTSGIGKEFADEFARQGLNLMLISRTESKLKEQANELVKKFGIGAKYMVYNFAAEQTGSTKKAFYKKLDEECAKMSKDGRLGMLINNVGTNEDHPVAFDEYDDDGIENMLNCNVQSVLWMTKTVLPHMKAQKNGCVVSISSGSGNHPGPYNSLYSATKAFMTQFSRSMHVENWGTGVDFLVVTPFYIVSNLYKRKTGTFLAPMPIELVKGTLAQLGKKYVWQGHGYWFHGILGNAATYFWGTTARFRKMMIDNRVRWEERQNQKAE